MRYTVLAAAAAVVLLAGCAGSDDLDGNGGRPPSASSSPVEALPAVGACLTSGGNIAYADKADPATKSVSCDTPHKLEVVSTGRFPDSGQVPGWGSDALRAVYGECGKAATAYLGADWHGGWLFLHIGRPAGADWAGGARGYVCSIAEFERTDSSAPALERTGTLRGDLAPGGPGKVAQHCATLIAQDPDAQGFYDGASQRRSDCAALHDAEYAGSVEQPAGVFPAWESQQAFARDKCDALVAGLLGLTPQALTKRHDVRSLLTYLDDQSEWQAGERSNLCYATVSQSHKVRASIKDLRSGPLPY
ncbi:septum formation family protein [Dactylosporangium sp. NPDC051485]|uniref:septum formation family protein n=1 Tax=Dactylosporangium sp. NPDC051485 TaxID=3154846 RepID=UPI00341E3FCD